MTERKAIVTSADEVEEEIAEFLVPKRIPRGELSLLAGMPDRGKSLWYIEVAACLTRGDFGPPARVLITSTEDSISKQIKPRLRAAGAVLNRVAFVAMQVGDEDVGHIRFPDDVREFGRVIEEGDFRFAVIDPVLGHINSRLISAFKDEQLRDGLMTPLSQIAQQNDCAILGVMHFNKREEGEALVRVAGSLGGIVGPARSLLLLHQHPENEGERVLTHNKSNHGPKASPLLYEMATVPLEIQGRTVTHPHLRFVGECDLTTEELIGGKKGDSHAVAEAVEFFRRELAEGSRPSLELRKLARSLGISDHAWNQAKKRLGVVSRKSDFDGGWELSMPFYITTNRSAD